MLLATFQSGAQTSSKSLFKIRNMTTRICLLGRASHKDRFQPLSKLLQHDYDIYAKTLIYRDDATLSEIEEEITGVGNKYNAVLCWVDPIFPDDDGNEMSRECGDNLGTAGLDDMLRRVSEKGILVSTHPDIISKIGTKKVLFDTRNEAWGSGSTTKLYKNAVDLKENLVKLLLLNPHIPRVLKMERGCSGKGVWRCEINNSPSKTCTTTQDIFLRVQHAGDDIVEEHVHINDFIARVSKRMASFGGGVVDMPYFPRINEGIIRCYMFRGRCGGVLHQTDVELIESCQHPKLRKLNLTRGYKVETPSNSKHKELAKILEEEWIPKLLTNVGLLEGQESSSQVFSKSKDKLQSKMDVMLPVIWDMNFIYRSTSNEDGKCEVDPANVLRSSKYVLCEINCSCVFSEELMEETAKEISHWLNDNIPRP